MMIFCFGIALILIGLIVSFAGSFINMSATLAAVIIAVLFALCAAAFLLLGRKAKNNSGDECNKGEKERFLQLSTKTDVLFLVLTAILIIFEIIMVILYAFVDPAAFESIGTGTRVFETGRLASGSPMMNLYGIISYVLGVHPLKLIFGFLPAPVILFFNLGFYELLKLLCDDRREVMPSMCFIQLLLIWGYYCRKLIPFSLLISWYSGECFAVCGVFVAIGIVLAHKRKRIKKEPVKEDERSNDEESEDYLEEWDMKKHKIINARNLAIAMGVMLILLGAVTLILNRKINDLYGATVNLETALNSRCSIYEFAPDKGDVQGYLIKGTDGSLTVIGGGDAANSGALRDFITQYGTNISDWYVYSDEPEDTGAMAGILSGDSLNVENVYVLNREDVSKYIK